MEEITNIENFFKFRQIHLSGAWLEGCINWCKEEKLSANYTIQDLQFEIFQQWLLLDLRDIKVPCLPPELASQVKYVLDGIYTLQLMQVVDISKPKYWQLQKIRNNISKNLEQELESTKRVLQLKLTDGVQEVEAMEYKPIQCLHLNLSPGTKLRLTGPIMIRRGRLMLENTHVSVIGGEVDTLLVSNAAENILATCLELPLNPKPQTIEENLLIVNNSNCNETGQHITLTSNNTTVNQQLPQYNNCIPNSMVNQSNSVRNQNVQPPTSNTHASDFGDLEFEEELRLDEEIEMLMEVERDFEREKIVTTKKQNTPDLFDDMEIDFNNLDIPDTVISVQNVNNKEQKNNMPKQQTKPTKKQPDITNFFEKVQSSTEPVDCNTILASRLVQPKLTTQGPSETVYAANFPESRPIQSNNNRRIVTPTPQLEIIQIDKLLKLVPNTSKCKFKIKAKFKSVIEKMSVKDDLFHLVIEVTDASGNITLKVHNDVVADLMGYTAKVFMGFRTEIDKNSMDAHRKALEALKSLQTKLLSLDDILEVLLNTTENYPVLVKILY